MRHDAMPRVIAGPPASTPSSRSISLAVRHGQLYLVYITTSAAYVFEDGSQLTQVIDDPFHGQPLDRVALDRRSGSLALAAGQHVKIYDEVATFNPNLQHSGETKPDGQESGRLIVKWIYARETTVKGSSIRSLSWGLGKEILVANDHLSLFYPSSAGQTNELRNTWSFPLSTAVEDAQFSPDASFIVSRGTHDRLVKVWRRLSDRVTASGSKTSDFDFIYLPHDRTVNEVSWRQPFNEDLQVDNIVYSNSTDGQFRAWASNIPHDSHLLTCHESLSMESKDKKIGIPVVLDDDVFSWALAKALRNSTVEQQQHAKTKSLLKRIGTGQPEIVLILDANGGMTAHALYNLGNRNHKPSSQEQFFRTNTFGLLREADWTETSWIKVDVQRKGEHDLLFFVGNSRGVTIYQTKLLDVFGLEGGCQTFEMVNTLCGHRYFINQLRPSSDGRLVSVDTEGSTMKWQSRGMQLEALSACDLFADNIEKQIVVPDHISSNLIGQILHAETMGDFTAIVSGTTSNTVQIWGPELSTSFSGAFESSLSCSGPIKAISWTKSCTGNQILAVASNSLIHLLSTKLLVDDADHRWTNFWSFDLSTTVSHSIDTLCFVSSDLLAFSAGSQMFTLAADDWNTSELILKSSKGPVPVYHPNYLCGLLSLGKLDGVRLVLSTLYDRLVSSSESVKLGSDLSLTDDQIFEADNTKVTPSTNGNTQSRYNALFVTSEADTAADESALLGTSKASSLSSLLHDIDLDELTKEQQARIGKLAIALANVQAEESSLDQMGLRFYLSYVMMQGRDASDDNGDRNSTVTNQDVYWAFRSEKQDILLNLVRSTVKSMTWQVAKSAKIFYWLKDRKALLELAEDIAKAEFLKGEDRDPVSASLWYHALQKKAVLLSLWRMCGSHPEHNLTSKILANDFTEAKWKTAANKNAFALIGKRRFEYAAAWFLLAGSLKDAVSVCVRNVQDLDLALALARIYEEATGPVLRKLLETDIMTAAKEIGSRIMVCWCAEFLSDLTDSMQTLMKPFTTSTRDTPDLLAVYSDLRERLGAHHREQDFIRYIAYLQQERGCDHLAQHVRDSWQYREPVSQTDAAMHREEVTIEDYMTKKKETLVEAPRAVYEEPTMDSFAAFDF